MSHVDEDYENTSMVQRLPTELLLNIFTHLPAKQLIRLREVCVRWRNVVDGLARSDSLWRKHCETDFPDLFKIARYKARVGMIWFSVYRSLSLWPLLNLAQEIRTEFASASSLNEEIRGFEILRDGIIGVHKRDSIVYYDTETLEVSQRGAITGDYMHYAENEDAIIVHSCNLHLFVIRKILHNPHFKVNTTFDGVKFSLMAGENLYYVDLNNDIYNCKLKDGNLTSTLMKHSEESIMCLGYGDNPNVLTFERNIYTIVEDNLVLACNLDESRNILHELYKFKFVETTDWRVVFQWMCILRRKLPEGPLQEISTVRVYGDVFLVGCNWGVLRIYYAPFSNGEFDLYNAQPVKQYNFMEHSDCPVLTMCPILKVDVLEAVDGHIIIVAMPKKIAVLGFVHSFRREPSEAMVQYGEVHDLANKD